MKKTLLSLAAMLLLAGGASAQTAKSATVYTDKVEEGKGSYDEGGRI